MDIGAGIGNREGTHGRSLAAANSTTLAVWLRPSNVAFFIAALAGIILAACQLTSKCAHGFNVYGLVGAILAVALGLYDRTVHTPERQTWTSLGESLWALRTCITEPLVRALLLSLYDIPIGLNLLGAWEPLLYRFTESCDVERPGVDDLVTWLQEKSNLRAPLLVGTALAVATGIVVSFPATFVLALKYTPGNWSELARSVVQVLAMFLGGFVNFAAGFALAISSFVALRVLGSLVATLPWAIRICRAASDADDTCLEFFYDAQESRWILSARIVGPLLYFAVFILIWFFRGLRLDFSWVVASVLLSPAPLGFLIISVVWVYSFIYFCIVSTPPTDRHLPSGCACEAVRISQTRAQIPSIVATPPP